MSRPPLPPLLALLQRRTTATFTPFDWQTIKAQAEEHALVAVLATQYETLLPPDLLAAWRPRVHRLASSNLVLELETAAVLAGLAGQSIAAAEIKGPGLARRLYGSPTAREIADIDLLVQEPDVPAADRWLVAAGWERDERARSAALARREHHHWMFRREDRPLPLLLELHWNLGPPSPFQLTPAEIWRHLTRTPDGTWRLVPDLELVALALHLFQHNFAPLARIVDLAHFVRIMAPHLDGGRLAALCTNHTRRRLVILAVLVATRALAVPLPTPLEPWADRRVRLASRALPPAALLVRPRFDYSRYYLTGLLLGEVRVAGDRALRSLLYPSGWERAPASQRLLHPLRLANRYRRRLRGTMRGE